jgi:type IV secretory pathway TraG/TraD family ATPase VirD4
MASHLVAQFWPGVAAVGEDMAQPWKALTYPREHICGTVPVLNISRMTTNHLGTTDASVVHPVVASVAREVLNKSDNERSGVLSTAMSFLSLYPDPTVAAVTSLCDWRIADLVEGKSPVSLYLVVPPSDISRTKPLIRLVLNQIGRRRQSICTPRTATTPLPHTNC